jgi:hypothetical protein
MSRRRAAFRAHTDSRAREAAGKAPPSRSPSPKPKLPAEALCQLNAVLNHLAAAAISQPRGATPDTEGHMQEIMCQHPTGNQSPGSLFELGSLRGASADTQFTLPLPLAVAPIADSDDQTVAELEPEPKIVPAFRVADDEITHVSATSSASRSTTPVFGGADRDDNAIFFAPTGLEFVRIINVDDATTTFSSIQLIA